MKVQILALCVGALSLSTILSCDLSTANKEKEPEIEGFFRAELNGKEWDEKYTNASVLDLNGNCWLNLFSDSHKEEVFPPDSRISLTSNYVDGQNQYNILRQEEENGRTTGARLSERDWDAGYAKYEPIQESENHLTIFVEKDEEGRNIISGSFSATLVVLEKYTDPRYLPYRKYADTVRIRNGEFETVLKVRKDVRDTKNVCGWLIDDSEE